MNHVGYGITIDGKPHGLWPTSFAETSKAAKRYRERGHDGVEIVPVHCGEPAKEYAPVDFELPEPAA